MHQGEGGRPLEDHEAEVPGPSDQRRGETGWANAAIYKVEGATVKVAGKALSLEHPRPPSTHLRNGVLSRDWEDWALHTTSNGLARARCSHAAQPPGTLG